MYKEEGEKVGENGKQEIPNLRDFSRGVNLTKIYAGPSDVSGRLSSKEVYGENKTVRGSEIGAAGKAPKKRRRERERERRGRRSCVRGTKEKRQVEGGEWTKRRSSFVLSRAILMRRTCYKRLSHVASDTFRTREHERESEKERRVAKECEKALGAPAWNTNEYRGQISRRRPRLPAPLHFNSLSHYEWGTSLRNAHEMSEAC